MIVPVAAEPEAAAGAGAAAGAVEVPAAGDAAPAAVVVPAGEAAAPEGDADGEPTRAAGPPAEVVVELPVDFAAEVEPLPAVDGSVGSAAPPPPPPHPAAPTSAVPSTTRARSRAVRATSRVPSLIPRLERDCLFVSMGGGTAAPAGPDVSRPAAEPPHPNRAAPREPGKPPMTLTGRAGPS